MLDRDAASPARGPREMIARLAAAVMIADGRVTEDEVCAVDYLHELGLGSLAPFVEAEIARGARAPIDVVGTAAALAAVAPAAAGVIVSGLAHIAASDRELSPREIEVLNSIADALGLESAAAAQIIRWAAASAGASLAEEPRQSLASRLDSGSGREAARAPESRTAAASEPQRARPVWLGRRALLGLAATASAEQVDAAYAALVRRYDPATVVDLGPEFAVLAVQKLNAITAAYVAVRAALAAR